MKSKFVMLFAISTLTLSGISAMAAGKPAQGALRGPKAVTGSSRIVKASASARLGNATKGSPTAPISHTVSGK